MIKTRREEKENKKNCTNCIFMVKGYRRWLIFFKKPVYRCGIDGLTTEGWIEGIMLEHQRCKKYKRRKI
jgi:hypothetical protein